MALHYTRTGEPASPLQPHDWDNFIYDAKRCPNCGRSSLILDHCPDCGGSMSDGIRGSAAGYIFQFLFTILGCALAQVCIIYLMRYLTAGMRVAVAILCLVIHVPCLFLVVYFLIKNFSQMRLLHQRDVWHQVTGAGPFSHRILHWRFLHTIYDGYYLDIAHLEQKCLELKPGERHLRDIYLGQAIWLSTISDCPRLALLRFRLLCAAPVYEGMDMDLNSIVNQMNLMDSTVLRDLFTRPDRILSLCDCLRFDPIGLTEENLLLCLSYILFFLNHEDGFAQVTPCERQRIIQTLAYFGPDAYPEDLFSDLLTADINAELKHYNPDFRTVLFTD